MSEGELVNGARAGEAALEDGGLDEDGVDQLDDEATALLKELQDSQLEVQRMIDEQRAQASELGDMKESLASELQQLQDESWKLQVFAELEMLKRQLAAINSLDADLDAMEARLDEAGEDSAVDAALEKELAAARAGTRELIARLGRDAGTVLTAAEAVAAIAESSSSDADGPAANGAGAGAPGAHSRAGAGARALAAVDEQEEEGEGEAEDVEALQDALDAELAAMYKQLQDIKAESAQVAARKAQLELELMQLLRDGAEEITAQLTDLTVEPPAEEEASGAEAAAEDRGEAVEAAGDGAEPVGDDGPEGQADSGGGTDGDVAAAPEAPDPSEVASGPEAGSGNEGEGEGPTA